MGTFAETPLEARPPAPQNRRCQSFRRIHVSRCKDKGEARWKSSRLSLPVSPASALFLTPYLTSPSLRLCALPLSHRSLPPAACRLPSGGSQLRRLLRRQHSCPTTKVSSHPSLPPHPQHRCLLPSLSNPPIPPSLFPPFASHLRPALRRPQRLSLSPHPPSVDVSSPLSPALPSLPLSSFLFASHHSPSPASPTARHLPFGGSFSSKLAVFRPSLPPFFQAALLRAAIDRLFVSSSRQPAAIRTSSKNLPPFPALLQKSPVFIEATRGTPPHLQPVTPAHGPSHAETFLLFYRFGVFF